VSAQRPPEDRIRLLQLVTNFKFGGTERHLSNVVRLIDRSRFEVHLACLGKYGEFLERVERDCGSIDEYPIRRLHGPSTVWRQLQLARDLRRQRIQVIHTYGFYANMFALPAARLAGVPVIVASVRDTGDHLNATRRHVHRLACRLADCVLVNAEAVRQQWNAAGFRSSKMAVIRNGINLTHFTPGPRDAARQALGVPLTVPLVTVVSRLNRLKGIEHFLEAARRVLVRRPDVHFLVVGDSEPSPSQAAYRASLEGLTVRLGLAERVLFTGFRSDVPQLLGASTISVLPSLSEALSNVLLESMAAGLPVVATAVGGTAEAVQHGRTGFLVPPADPAALAEAITCLLEHPQLAQRYGEAARTRVREHFSDARMVHDTEQFYLGLLAKGRRAASRRGSCGRQPHELC
jgi:L-malate glycosyltransferase